MPHYEPTNIYEVSMQFFDDDESYREHVFIANDDVTAVMHGLIWPGLNGWTTATKITVARYYLPQVASDGRVSSSGVRIIIAENHMIEPVLWPSMDQPDLSSHARGLIASERHRFDEEEGD